MNEMLSQEEIDALLSGTTTSNTNDNFDNAYFTEEEKDAIGEIGNISMGTAATTLSTLLGNRVNITTPRVSVLSLDDLAHEYPLPFVAVDVQYKEGLEGLNVLILKEEDVKIITDLMMGGGGVANEDPLSDIHLSAIGEAMNQMVGSASTSLSEMFTKKIDIFPPRVFPLDLTSDKFRDLFPEFTMRFVRISFRMVIGDLIDSEIMQLVPLDFAKEMINRLMNNYGGGEAPPVENKKATDGTSKQSTVSTPQLQQTHTQNIRGEEPVYIQPTPQPAKQPPVNVQPAQFQAFDQGNIRGVPENIEIIQDVPLNVTVELGRTVKRISEILEFGPGTIIELDKLVGETLDILVNGQYVAKGEVVVIDENYGIRITDIVSPTKRFSKI